MIGDRTVMYEALFYNFSLEQHAPTDHLLRSIDRFVDLSSVREHLRPYYSETGRHHDAYAGAKMHRGYSSNGVSGVVATRAART